MNVMMSNVYVFVNICIINYSLCQIFFKLELHNSSKYYETVVQKLLFSQIKDHIT